MTKLNIDKYIFEKDGHWFFWDETWDSMGPYQTKEEAIEKFYDYIIWLDKE